MVSTFQTVYYACLLVSMLLTSKTCNPPPSRVGTPAHILISTVIVPGEVCLWLSYKPVVFFNRSLFSSLQRERDEWSLNRDKLGAEIISLRDSSQVRILGYNLFLS